VVLAGGVGGLWCWFALLFCSPILDSVIQLLEDSNKLLELMRDIVRQSKDILDRNVQAPHKGSTFCRVIPLNIGSIVLEFSIIGGEVIVCLFEYLQFSFCCHHMIWFPEICFQNRHQGWEICQVNALISDLGLDSHKGLAH
jgi:hypothetical protein